MLSGLTRTMHRTIAVAAAGLLTASAAATVLPPGGTVDPVVGAALPSGAVLETTISHPYDISYVQFPFTRHITGTVTQNVYRLADNTLLFRYSLTNDASSIGAPDQVGCRYFEDWTTDVNYGTGFIVTGVIPDRARRSAGGETVSFEFDLGIPTGDHSRQLSIRTNAVSYRIYSSRGPFYPISAGRVTVSSGTNYDNVYGFAYPVLDSTPPVATITGPGELSCSCNPITITGSASDAQGFEGYIVEYSADANGPWTEIVSSTTPVSNGTLASWDTTGVAEGYYFVRLTAVNTADLSSEVTSVVYVDQSLSTLDLRSPSNAGGNTPLIGGSLCFDGTVWDTCSSTYTIQYRALPGGVFAHVAPGTPVYAGQVVNDGLGGWNTSSGPTAVPDGLYQVRVTGTDGCGHTASVVRDVRVDNTAPIASIASPTPCTYVNGIVQITGTASDANIAGWALQYTGGGSSTWTTIASGNSSIVNGVLANWDVSHLRPCSYSLRLLVGDRAAVNCGSTNNQAEFLVSVDVGCRADFNRDGAGNSQDFFDFLSFFFAGCP